MTLFHAEGRTYGFYLMWLFTALFGMTRISVRILQALMMQRVVKWSIFIESGVRLLLVGFWIYQNGGTLPMADALISLCAAAAMGVAVLEVALWREIRALRRAKTGSGVHPAKSELLRFSRNNYFQALLSYPSDPSSLRLLGAYYLQPGAMAAFGFFQTFTGAFRRNLPIQMLLDFIEPVMMAAYFRERDLSRLNRMTGSVLKVNLFLLVPLLVWLVAEARSVTSLLTGGKYVEHAWMLPVMVLGLIYESHWIVLRTVSNTLDKSALLMRASAWSILGLAATLGLMLAAEEARLEVLVFGGLLMQMWRNLYVPGKLRRAGFGYRFDRKGVAKLFLAATLAMALAVPLEMLIQTGSMSWLFTGSVALALYLFLVRAVKPFGVEEQALLLKVHSRFGCLF